MPDMPARSGAAKRKRREGDDEGPEKKRPAAAHRKHLHPTHGQVPSSIYVFGFDPTNPDGLGFGEDGNQQAQRRWKLELPGGLKTLQVACGKAHTVLLAEDGSVWTWGANDLGQLGRHTREEEEEEGPAMVEMPEGAGRVVQVTAGCSHTLALTEGGAVYAWGTWKDCNGKWASVLPGSDTKIQRTPALVYPPPGSTGVPAMKLASGLNHALALLADSTVLSWGCNEHGQLGRNTIAWKDNHKTNSVHFTTPKELKLGPLLVHGAKAVDVACGYNSSFVVLDDGAVVACGRNNCGQLGFKTPKVEVKVVVDGEQKRKMEQVEWEPVLVERLARAKAVASGEYHTLVLTQDGKVLTFGWAADGVLGRLDGGVNPNTPELFLEPKPVERLLPATPKDGSNPAEVAVAGICAGGRSSGCWSTAGSAWLWGVNDIVFGFLGLGPEKAVCPVPEPLQFAVREVKQRVVGVQLGWHHGALLTVPLVEEEEQEEAAAAAAAAPTEEQGGAGPSACKPQEPPATGQLDAQAAAVAAGEAAAAEGEQSLQALSVQPEGREQRAAKQAEREARLKEWEALVAETAQRKDQQLADEQEVEERAEVEEPASIASPSSVPAQVEHSPPAPVVPGAPEGSASQDAEDKEEEQQQQEEDEQHHDEPQPMSAAGRTDV